MSRRRADWLGVAGLVALSIAGLSAAASLERRSVERANRLHRAGDFPDAARLFAARASADTTSVRLAYNFGTTLLDLGNAAARAELERAAESPDTALRARSLYNLGRWHLLRARDLSAPDSVRAHAMGAVEANKGALRLEPGRPDARWNLTLAQRMLDSMVADDGRAGTENVDGSADSDERALSDELREFEDDTQLPDAPRQGADEALAQGDEIAPLSALEAEQILTADVDRSVIVRKLLTYAGRTRSRPFGAPTGPRW